MAPIPKTLPAEDLRARLDDARRRGLDFDAAWQAAWRAVRWPTDSGLRRDWKDALTISRPEWRAAYERRPTAFSRAYGALLPHLPMSDREPDPRRGSPDTRGRRRGVLVA